MYLNQRNEKTSLSELSERLKLSRNSLIKISTRLSKLGYISTVRGEKGGLLINEKAGSLTIREIVVNTEETFRMAECFTNKKISCVFLPSCQLQTTLARALNAFLESLDETTLDDVTPKYKGAMVESRGHIDAKKEILEHGRIPDGSLIPSSK